MGEPENSTLDKINELLEEIKDRLNKTDEENNEYTLHIVDQDNSPVRSRTEDIELKIRSLVLSKK